jgi:hypothetical protein
MECGRAERKLVKLRQARPSFLSVVQQVPGILGALAEYAGRVGTKDRGHFGVVEAGVRAMLAMELKEEPAWTAEEAEDDATPAAEYRPDILLKKPPPPPSYPEMRAQLCQEDPKDPKFVPSEMRHLLFRHGKFGAHELRSLWAAQFAPTLKELLVGYGLVPYDVATLMLGLTKDGEKLLGASIFKSLPLAALPQAVRARVEALHKAYKLPYMSRVKDFIVALQGLASRRGGGAEPEVWLDLREVFLCQWMGQLRGRDFAFSDRFGTLRMSVQVTLIPGTFRVRWISVGTLTLYCWLKGRWIGACVYASY